jgi:hypothetical protein
MCANCQNVFASNAGLEDTVTCPVCGHEGKPERIMKATGFPNLETFTQNWQLSRKVIEVKNDK